MLSIARPAAPVDERPRDVVFVVDTSGSMAGAKIAQARRALAYCINTLRAGDRFDVLRFSNVIEPLSGKLVAATPAARAHAVRWLERLDATGGTDIGGALVRALDAFSGADARPRYIVLLTDGEPMAGETDPAAIRARVRAANRAGTRVFTFGIDEAAHLPLLAGLARENRGESLSVGARDDLSTQLPLFFGRLVVPLFEDVTLAWSGVEVRAAHPRTLPHFYLGRQLAVVGRYAAPGAGTVTVHARVDGRPVSYAMPVSLPERDDGGVAIPRLWARAEADALLSGREPAAVPAEVREEVVRLSMAHRFVTPFTSFIAVPDSERERLPEDLRDRLDARAHVVPRVGPDGRVTVEVPEARPLGVVLDELGRAGGFRVELPAGVSRDTKVELDPMPPEDAVETLAARQGLTVRRENGALRLVAPEPERAEPDPRRHVAGPRDFAFEDVELGTIFRSIAAQGKFHVAIDPQIARAKMVVSLKQVEPLDALFLIARIQELKVKRVRWEVGSTTVTYAIARQEKIEKSFEQANTRTLQLRYTRAEDVARILARGLGKDVNVGVEKDARTNKLLFKGTEEVLSRVEELVRQLDRGGASSLTDLNAGVGSIRVHPGTAAAATPVAPAPAASALDRGYRELQEKVVTLRLRLAVMRARVAALAHSPAAPPLIESVRVEPALVAGGARARIALALRSEPGPRSEVTWTAASGQLTDATARGATWEAPFYPGVHAITVEVRVPGRAPVTLAVEVVVLAPGRVTYAPRYLDARVEALEAELAGLASEHAALAAELERALAR